MSELPESRFDFADMGEDRIRFRIFSYREPQSVFGGMHLRNGKLLRIAQLMLPLKGSDYQVAKIIGICPETVRKLRKAIRLFRPMTRLHTQKVPNKHRYGQLLSREKTIR